MTAIVKASQTGIVSRDYNGVTFKFRQDGYFDMTHASKQFSRDIRDFFKNVSTTDYIDAYQDSILIDGKTTQLKLVEAKAGRYGGTWAHPKLAVFFARWLDAKFAVFCDAVIDDLINGHAEVRILNDEKAVSNKMPQTYLESLQELVKAVEEQERLKLEVEVKQALITEQTPKVEFFEEFIEADGSLGIQAASRLLKMNMRELGHWLVDEKLCFRRSVDGASRLIPYSAKIDQGLFLVKTGLRPGTHGPHSFEQLMITNKGLAFIEKNAPDYVRK